jgi:4-hydroxybenzoate polyprenyltransferase
VALSYFLLAIVYSLFLKNIVILDVLAVSSGFVLRVVAGTVVIGVEMSSWLLICTIFLALFLVLGKRRHEIVSLGPEQRPESLQRYNPHLLDQMIAMVTTSTVLTYSLYTMAEETVARFGTINLKFTIPFAIYGVFRYLYLIYRKNVGGSLEEIIFKDKLLLAGICLWILSAVIVIYI